MSSDPLDSFVMTAYQSELISEIESLIYKDNMQRIQKGMKEVFKPEKYAEQLFSILKDLLNQTTNESCSNRDKKSFFVCKCS